MRKNVLLSFLFFTVSILAVVALNNINNIKEQTFKTFPYILLDGLLFIPIGCMLGIPKLIDKKNENGHWIFNFTNFTVFAVPSLLIMFYPIIHNYVAKLPYFMTSAILGTSPYPIFGLTFGYSLISNWNKVE